MCNIIASSSLKSLSKKMFIEYEYLLHTKIKWQESSFIPRVHKYNWG